MNKCNCEGHRGDSHFCPLHGEVTHPDHAEGTTMSDKPEALGEIWIDDHCSIDDAEIYAEEQFDSVKYIRADLAKLSECNGQCPECQKDLESKIEELEKQVKMAYGAGQMMCECDKDVKPLPTPPRERTG